MDQEGRIVRLFVFSDGRTEARHHAHVGLAGEFHTGGAVLCFLGFKVFLLCEKSRDAGQGRVEGHM